MLYPKHKIEQNTEYFALTLTANTKGALVIGAQTIWVGFADPDNRVELREPSVVTPDKMTDFWTEFGMPFCIVNTHRDLLGWLATGGHALVRREIAIESFPESTRPSSCVKTGKFGFNDLTTLPDTIFKPAPTPKIRMRILKRDNFRCRICGRRPDNNVDIELHVHHITPFGEHGVTHEDNLITLCHTCHQGLDPHHEWALYDLIEDSTADDLKTRKRREYFEEVRRYQECIQQRVSERMQTEPPAPGYSGPAARSLAPEP